VGETAAELRADLARQREDLSRDLEVIGDRVSPGRMVERRRAAVRMRFGRARDAVMGAKDGASSRASHAAESVQGAASSVADTVTEAPEMVRQRAQGNPMAAGLVAFGTGLLVATVVPTSRKEEEVAQRLQPTLESAASEAGSAAQHAVEEVKPKVREAVEDVKATAHESVETVKQEAQHEVQHAQQAQQAPQGGDPATSVGTSTIPAPPRPAGT
jgi:gas vesicle protein